MVTRTIRSESKLVELIKEDIEDSEKAKVKILAGHLPLLYHNDGPGNRHAELVVDRWGEFSVYSFDLGCRLTRHALDNGREADLLVIVDDLVEIPRDAKNRRKVKHWMKQAQKRFYREHDLPEEYCRIAENYGVQDRILEQQRSFGSSRLISEAKLKFQALESGVVASNECSLAYNSLLNNPGLFDPNTDYLVSFIPGQCKGNICAGVLDVRDDLDASHVFFPHIEIMGGIIDTGSGFLKLADGATIRDIYDSGFVTYKKTISNLD